MVGAGEDAGTEELLRVLESASTERLAMLRAVRMQEHLGGAQDGTAEALTTESDLLYRRLPADARGASPNMGR